MNRLTQYDTSTPDGRTCALRETCRWIQWLLLWDRVTVAEAWDAKRRALDDYERSRCREN